MQQCKCNLIYEPIVRDTFTIYRQLSLECSMTPSIFLYVLCTYFCNINISETKRKGQRAWNQIQIEDWEHFFKNGIFKVSEYEHSMKRNFELFLTKIELAFNIYENFTYLFINIICEHFIEKLCLSYHTWKIHNLDLILCHFLAGSEFGKFLSCQRIRICKY